MCWRHKENAYNLNDEMPDERLIEAVDELAALGARECVIVGGGEPLVRGAVVMRMCERIRSNGMHGVLQHNATMLREEHARKLLEIHWNGIVCSLDGPNPEINDALRGKGTFDRATAAMARCAALKQQTGAVLPELTLYSTLTRQNHDVLSGMVELTARLGCTGTSAGAAVGDWCEDYLMTPAQWKAMPEIIARAEQRGKELGIPTNFDGLKQTSRSLLLRDRFVNLFLGKPAGLTGAYCYDPWHTLVVFPEGSVGGCCQGWCGEAPRITETSLKDIWTGPYFTKLRAQLARGIPQEYCHLCPPVLSNETIRLRRILQFQKAQENLPNLPWRKRAFVSAWERGGQLRRKLR